MKRHADISDTRRIEGSDGVHARHDKAYEFKPQLRELPSPSAPMMVARLFIEEHCQFGGVLTLRHWRGTWWGWHGSHWREIDDRAMRSKLYEFTEFAFYFVADAPAPWSPNRYKITDLADALAAACILESEIDQPAWLDDRLTGTIVAVANGLLDVEQRQLLPHTPQFFNQTAVPFDYDGAAPEPTRWLGFLGSLWPSEPEAINVLAEWMGYVVSGRTDLHKLLLMVGPTRGGKGVIARMLMALIGTRNVAGPTLNSLGGEFGLAPLIGKPLAIVSDARFGSGNHHVVIERLLSISGEDTLTVNRKYRDQWTGKLPSRLHIISNELPRLGDASTAIIGRIVLLVLSLSWLGKEDHGLEPALRNELPGLLNWALDGLHRLTVDNDNVFTRINSADEVVTTLRDLASPVGAFVRESCVISSTKQVKVDDLYAAFKDWAETNGHYRPSKEVFGRDLRAVVPSVRVQRPRDGDKRQRVYTGLTLSRVADHVDQGGLI